MRLRDIGEEVRDSVRPEPGATHELYSVPTFFTGAPERLDGASIGSAKRLVQPGDLLLCKINPRINRVWWVGQPNSTTQIASSEYLVLRLSDPDGTLLPWLVWYLRSPAFRSWIELNVEGATGSHTRAKSPVILEQFVPVAPRFDRERIVAQIDRQVSRLDAADRGLRAAHRKLSIYRDQLLRAASLGRLPLEAQLASPVGGELAALASGNGANGMPDLPRGWEWSTFRDVARRVTVGHVGPMKHEYVPSGVPFLRSQNVRANQLDLRGVKYISPAFHTRLAKSVLRPGDVVVVRSGDVGTACAIPPTVPEANCADLVIIQQPAIEGQFAAYYLNSAARRLIAEGRVGVALTHFNTKAVASLPVPVPPREIQERIVAEVESQLTLVDKLGEAINHGLARSASLRAHVLRMAFAGVPDSAPGTKS